MSIREPGMPWRLLEIRDWLDAWFVEKGKTDIAEDLFDNIDSLEVIDLIVSVEKCFRIKFTEKDFQNRKFSTLEGLSEIVRSKPRG